jgi:acyl-CoA reductase-like NAD-dependent aldehyde dehydrogenase
LPDANLDLAASRILWGRTINAGQTCASPEYVLCPSSLQDGLIAAFRKALHKFYGGKSPLVSSDFSKIISPARYEILKELIETTKGDIVIGGGSDSITRKIDITIVRNVKPDDVLMSDELFGPILPIVTVESKEEAVDFINMRSVGTTTCPSWTKVSLTLGFSRCQRQSFGYLCLLNEQECRVQSGNPIRSESDSVADATGPQYGPVHARVPLYTTT